MSSTPSPDGYEILVFYKVGIFGSSREAVSSFSFQVTEGTTLGELEDSISDKLTKAGLEVGAEFGQNLLDHLHDLMNEDHDEQDQAEPGAGERPPED